MSNVPIEELDIGTLAGIAGDAFAEHAQSASDSEDSETAGAIPTEFDHLAAAGGIEPIAEDEVAMHVTAAAVQRAAEKIGIIHTSFPEMLDADYTFDGIGPFPPSYVRYFCENSHIDLLLLLLSHVFQYRVPIAAHQRQGAPTVAVCRELSTAVQRPLRAPATADSGTMQRMRRAEIRQHQHSADVRAAHVADRIVDGDCGFCGGFCTL